jgi:hypothetical protein
MKILAVTGGDKPRRYNTPCSYPHWHSLKSNVIPHFIGIWPVSQNLPLKRSPVLSDLLAVPENRI